MSLVPAHRTTLAQINAWLKFNSKTCWVGEVRGPLSVMTDGKVCERHFVLLFWKPWIGLGEVIRSKWYFFDLPLLG